jgi:Calcineurin-like phosphoesterase
MESYMLQYGSDFHLTEKSPPFSLLLEPSAPDLALCGDLGDPFSDVYGQFLQWCSRRWERVFVIAGNHEYFVSESTVDMAATEAQIRRTCEAAGPNVIFLQKGTFLIPSHKVVVLGTTLWSTPELRRWDTMSEDFLGSPGSRGEYRAIFKDDEYTGKRRPLHPSDITAISQNQIAWLRRQLHPTWGTIPEGWRVIVLTHYLPTYRLNPPTYKDHKWRSCYALSMDELLKEPVVAWICGHSHTAQTLRFDTGCLVTLNPFGYEHEAGNNGFSRRKSVVVYRENFASAIGGGVKN